MVSCLFSDQNFVSVFSFLLVYKCAFHLISPSFTRRNNIRWAVLIIFSKDSITTSAKLEEELTNCGEESLTVSWLRRFVAGLTACQSMWNLWWTKWHWDRFFFEFDSFSLSVSLHRGSPYSCIISGTNSRPVCGRNSETTITRVHSWKTNSYSVCKKIRALWVRKVHCRFQKSPQLDCSEPI
jgi:hypothetical protein